MKTIAKLYLGTKEGKVYTYRSFVSVVSLICYAIHTTWMNPAKFFTLLSTNRALYSQVCPQERAGMTWDRPLNRLYS